MKSICHYPKVKSKPATDTLWLLRSNYEHHLEYLRRRRRPLPSASAYAGPICCWLGSSLLHGQTCSLGCHKTPSLSPCRYRNQHKMTSVYGSVTHNGYFTSKFDSSQTPSSYFCFHVLVSIVRNWY